MTGPDAGQEPSAAPRRADDSRSRLPESGPDVRFHHFFPDGPMPVPAGTILRDLLPAKAVKRCPPVTAASSFGWLLFPPASFAVRWVRDRLEFTLVDDEGSLGDWEVLDAGRPGSNPATAEALAGIPEHRRDALLPTLTEGVPLVDPNPSDPRELQVFTGVTVRTAPGWATLVRPVPNLPMPPESHDIVDGIVETAWYGNGLPVMVRLRARDEVVRFSRSAPLAAIQPFPLAALTPANSTAETGGSGIGAWPEDEWERFIETRRRRTDALPGSYRRAQHAYHHEPAPVELD